MPNRQPAFFARDDTFFGVCEALGEDFRIPANLLRIGLAVLTFWSPPAAIGLYAGAGLLVGLSRWLAPNPPLPAEPEPAFAAAQPAEAECQPPLPLAA